MSDISFVEAYVGHADVIVWYATQSYAVCADSMDGMGCGDHALMTPSRPRMPTLWTSCIRRCLEGDEGTKEFVTKGQQEGLNGLRDGA